MEIPIPSYTVEPTTCDDGDENGINFIIVQSPSSPEVIRDGDKLLIETDDPNDFGTLTVTLRIEPASSSPVNPVEVVYTVNLNRCKLDEVTTTTAISDFEITIGENPITVGPNMVNLFPECPVSYRLTQDGELPGDFYQGVFSFNTETGVLVVDDNDIDGLEGVSFGLTLEGIAEETGVAAE